MPNGILLTCLLTHCLLVFEDRLCTWRDAVNTGHLSPLPPSSPFPFHLFAETSSSLLPSPCQFPSPPSSPHLPLWPPPCWAMLFRHLIKVIVDLNSYSNASIIMLPRETLGDSKQALNLFHMNQKQLPRKQFNSRD